MSRLGPWAPTTIEERVDRMESLAEIQQLPARYALAIDSRDMDALVELFVPHVRVGRERSGRPALKEWFTETMRAWGPSVHIVADHVVDFADRDHATGVVYCHDELSVPDSDGWLTGRLQYWDAYERVAGEWSFARRRFHRWYLVDALERPAAGAGVGGGADALTTHALPEAFPTWAPFWADRPDGAGAVVGGTR